MKKTFAIAAAALLAACGGGADGSPAGPGEPNDTAGQATPIALGTPIVATISSGTDYDYYKLTLASPASVRIQTFDRGGTSCDLVNDTVDTYVEVQDASGSDLTACSGDSNWLPCDDSGLNWCEDLTLSLAAGANYVIVSGYPQYPFDYTLSVTAQ